MTRKEKIDHFIENGASPHDKAFKVWHTRDIALAVWARENGVHVQGMIGISGYSAFLFTDMPWKDEESFVVPELTKPKEVQRDRFFQVAAQCDHTIAAHDIYQLDHEKLVGDLFRGRTKRANVIALIELAHKLGVIDDYYAPRLMKIVVENTKL